MNTSPISEARLPKTVKANLYLRVIAPAPENHMVTVGTTIADRPPHRSVRARLRIRLLPWINGGKTACRTPPIPWDMQFPL
jgi:hypothetical protein